MVGFLFTPVRKLNLEPPASTVVASLRDPFSIEKEIPATLYLDCLFFLSATACACAFESYDGPYWKGPFPSSPLDPTTIYFSSVAS